LIPSSQAIGGRNAAAVIFQICPAAVVFSAIKNRKARFFSVLGTMAGGRIHRGG
jgi:hypothetical protein